MLVFCVTTGKEYFEYLLRYRPAVARRIRRMCPMTHVWAMSLLVYQEVFCEPTENTYLLERFFVIHSTRDIDAQLIAIQDGAFQRYIVTHVYNKTASL